MSCQHAQSSAEAWLLPVIWLQKVHLDRPPTRAHEHRQQEVLEIETRNACDLIWCSFPCIITFLGKDISKTTGDSLNSISW